MCSTFCNYLINRKVFLPCAPRSKFVESRFEYYVHHSPKIKRFSLCGSSQIVIHCLNCNNIRKVQNMVVSCGKGYFADSHFILCCPKPGKSGESEWEFCKIYILTTLRNHGVSNYISSGSKQFCLARGSLLFRISAPSRKPFQVGHGKMGKRQVSGYQLINKNVCCPVKYR